MRDDEDERNDLLFCCTYNEWQLPVVCAQRLIFTLLTSSTWKTWTKRFIAHRIDKTKWEWTTDNGAIEIKHSTFFKWWNFKKSPARTHAHPSLTHYLWCSSVFMCTAHIFAVSSADGIFLSFVLLSFAIPFGFYCTVHSICQVTGSHFVVIVSQRNESLLSNVCVYVCVLVDLISFR